MIRINLLPVKEAQRALGRRRQLSVALLSVVLAVLMMVVPFMLQGRKLGQLDAENNQLRADIAKLDDQTREVRDLDKKRDDLHAKLKVIEELKQKRIGPVHVLDDLGAATPEKLWLIDFSDQSGAATITGMALDNQTIATFMRSLQASKYFYDVDLVETSQSEPVRGAIGESSGMNFKRFIVKARLDYLGMGGKQPSPADNRAAPKTGT